MKRTSASIWRAVFLAAAAFCGLTQLAAAAERPNIILCMADDQGWGDVGYNGHPRLLTPVLDEMAADNLRLDRFYAAAPVCSPTRGSVLTGRHPNRFGCFRWGYSLRPQEVTVAEALGQAGYVTGHFGKWHLGSFWPDSPVSPGRSGFDEWFSSPNFFDLNPLMCHNGKVVHAYGDSSIVTMSAALDFIRRAARGERPFLAVIWFGSPHGPYQALDEDRRPYRDLPERQQHYYGEITAIDRAMGMLRRELRRLGVAGHTLVWYTSDNGATGAGSTGGLRGKKGSIWEGGLRVPCVIEWPERITKPVRTSIPCGTVDIYPTVLELAGATVEHQPQPLDGVSLVPLIDGRMEARPKPLGFWDYPAPGKPVRSTQLLEQLEKELKGEAPASPPTEDPGVIAKRYPSDVLPGHAAWMDNRYKLHRIADKTGRQARYELYDLAEDPLEQHDLAADQPQRVERMKAELAQWQQSVVRSLNGEDY